jgi:hypothetical protein
VNFESEMTLPGFLDLTLPFAVSFVLFFVGTVSSGSRA